MGIVGTGIVGIGIGLDIVGARGSIGMAGGNLAQHWALDMAGVSVRLPKAAKSCIAFISFSRSQ